MRADEGALGRVVPTWNYVAVHLHGTARLVTGASETRRMVQDFVAHYETGAAEPWAIPADEAEFMDALVGAIVAFTIDVERVEASWKLNQHHPRDRRTRTIAELRRSGRPDQAAIADLMQRSAPPPT